MNRIDLNGDFVVCRKIEQNNLQNSKGTFVFNKETVPFFEILEKHFSAKDFPFEVGDVVCSASTGTIVKLPGEKEKIWLFRPEHILAKILTK